MHPFKRGFVEKCAEYGFDKEAAKELFKKVKKNLAAHEAGESVAKEEKEEACAKMAAAEPGLLDALKVFASQNKSQLMGAGVGAGLGGLAGAGIAGEGNRGKGALGGALLGGTGGYFAGPEIQAWINRKNMEGLPHVPGLKTKEDPAPYLKDINDFGPLKGSGPTSQELEMAKLQQELKRKSSSIQAMGKEIPKKEEIGPSGLPSPAMWNKGVDEQAKALNKAVDQTGEAASSWWNTIWPK
jgi:hypothetical protein